MIAATNSEMKNALAAHAELRCDDRKLYFADAQAPSITMDLRVKDAHQLMYLARWSLILDTRSTIFRTAISGSQHGESGALLRRPSVSRSWNSSGEAMGRIGLWRQPQVSTSATMSSPSQFVACYNRCWWAGTRTMFPPGFLGGLDYFVAVSHDLFVDINFRTREMHERSVEILRGHDWVRPLMK